MNILIDGNNMAFRNYYSHKGLSANGFPTGAIYGSLQTLKRYTEMFRSSKVITCWDTKVNPRKKLNPNYKKNRKMTPERKEVYDQITQLRQIIIHLGIPVVHDIDCEADDLIALLAKQLGNSLIISNDVDMYQILSSTVNILKPDTEITYTIETFKEAYNILPKDWATVLAIAGKTSNNVPGVPGVGIKNAIPYVQGLFDQMPNKKFKDRIDDCFKDGTMDDTLLLTRLPLYDLVPKIQRAFPDEITFYNLCVKYRLNSILKEFKEWKELFFR